jgi:hypothetical protein
MLPSPLPTTKRFVIPHDEAYASAKRHRIAIEDV